MMSIAVKGRAVNICTDTLYDGDELGLSFGRATGWQGNIPKASLCWWSTVRTEYVICGRKLSGDARRAFRRSSCSWVREVPEYVHTLAL